VEHWTSCLCLRRSIAIVTGSPIVAAIGPSIITTHSIPACSWAGHGCHWSRKKFNTTCAESPPTETIRCEFQQKYPNRALPTSASKVMSATATPTTHLVSTCCRQRNLPQQIDCQIGALQ
jgi:hypothetical protein